MKLARSCTCRNPPQLIHICIRCFNIVDCNAWEPMPEDAIKELVPITDQPGFIRFRCKPCVPLWFAEKRESRLLSGWRGQCEKEGTVFDVEAFKQFLSGQKDRVYFPGIAEMQDLLVSWREYQAKETTEEYAAMMDQEEDTAEAAKVAQGAE